MSDITLEQIMETVRQLPFEEQRRLRRWLEEQEHKAAGREREEDLRREEEKFRRALRWIDEHRAEYLGQWVALDGDRLISHGGDARQVDADARAAGIAAPLLELITEETLPPGTGIVG